MWWKRLQFSWHSIRNEIFNKLIGSNEYQAKIQTKELSLNLNKIFYISFFRIHFMLVNMNFILLKKNEKFI